MFCKNCGKKIKNDTNFCNYCGAKNNNSETNSDKMIGFILMTIGVVGFIYSMYMGSQAKSSWNRDDKILNMVTFGTISIFVFICGGIYFFNLGNHSNNRFPKINIEKIKFSEYNNINFNIRAKVWLNICVMLNGVMTLYNLHNITLLSKYKLDYYLKHIFDLQRGNPNIILITLGTAFICGLLIILIIKRTRLPFYVMASLAMLICFYNISVLPLDYIWTSLVGLGNPLITFLLIRKEWKYMPFR